MEHPYVVRGPVETEESSGAATEVMAVGNGGLPGRLLLLRNPYTETRSNRLTKRVTFLHEVP